MYVIYIQAMIKTIPNILAWSSNDFALQLTRLADFEVIDIDITVVPFADKNTVSVKESISMLASRKLAISFHLMEVEPIDSINLILKSGLNIDQIFIHQEADLTRVEGLPRNVQEKIGITIKRETKLKDIKFYNNYSSIQLMTGIFAGQGSVFDEEALAKSLALRSMGFEGEIGIDGGVNLNTAKIIKDYPIDRVSLGSYIHKSKNPMLDIMKLNLALNMRTVEESY